MTDYVATRWYRAPELIVSWTEYGKAIDIWSVGCILAELIARRPLFKGKDLLSQLRLIIDMLGTPTDDDLKDIGSPKAKSYIKSFGVIPAMDFAQVFSAASPVVVDLLKKLIVFNPVSQRLRCKLMIWCRLSV